MYKPDCNQISTLLNLWFYTRYIPCVAKRVGMVGLPYVLPAKLLTVIDLGPVVSTPVNSELALYINLCIPRNTCVQVYRLSTSPVSRGATGSIQEQLSTGQKGHNRRNKNMAGLGRSYPQKIRGHLLESGGIIDNVPSKIENW